MITSPFENPQKDKVHRSISILTKFLYPTIGGGGFLFFFQVVHAFVCAFVHVSVHLCIHMRFSLAQYLKTEWLNVCLIYIELSL